MTAQIISLVDYRTSAAAHPAAAPAASESAATALLPVAARFSGTAGAGLAKSAEPVTIAAATAALSAACRDMAINLATLMMHAEAACHSIGNIGETAEALVKTGADLRHVAETFQQDHDRMSTELSAAGLTAGTP
jgi:hypothetical protein